MNSEGDGFVQSSPGTVLVYRIIIAYHTLRREEIVSTLMYLIKLVKSTVLNVLTYLKVEQYTTKEMKCKGDL